MSEPQKSHPQADDFGLSDRVAGIWALVGGAILFYMGYVEPIVDAMSHSESVNVSMSVAGITPMVICIGVVYTVLGEKTQRYLGPRNSPSLIGWVFYVSTFCAGFAGYLALCAFIRSYGYDV